MAASLLFAQCKKSEDSAPSEAKLVEMTVTVGPGSKTDIASTGGITWSADDKLYVGYDGKYVGYLTLASGVGGVTGMFTGSVELTGVAEGSELTFHFYYLGSADHTSLSKGAEFVEVDFSSQDITKDGNGKLTNASKQHVCYGRANGTVIGGAVTDINVMMVSKVAIAHFNFKKGDADYKGALKLSGTNICNKMTVNFNSEVFACTGTKGDISLTNTTSSEKYVMLVPTDATTTSQTLTFTGYGVAESTTTLANGIKPNKFYGLEGAIAVTLEAVTVPVTGVTLNKSSLSLVVGGTATLEAIVEPDDATDPSVTWVSDDEDVATVDDNGVVTAVALGEATITVTTNDGSKTATCEVTVIEPVFSVKAGTTVEFSPGNLWYGKAEGEETAAFHFETNQWGTQPASNGEWVSDHVSHFFWSNTTDWQTSGKEPYASSYSYSTQTTSDVFFTEAEGFHVGSETDWRTLSKDEWDYLLDTRTNASSLRAWVTLTDVGVSGLVILPDNSTTTASSVTTKDAIASSGAVFLPAAGCRKDTKVSRVGSFGYYWSSTPNNSNEVCAYRMDFGSDNAHTANINRSNGYAVRLVR